jgi:hypothetical protein
MNYFYYLFALVPLLGYILSKINGRVPKGLIDRSQLSKKISDTANWQLPITVFGILFSYVYNSIICLLFFIFEVIYFITNWLIIIFKFIFKWIKFGVIWFYFNILSPTLIFLLRNIYHYIIITPFQILLIVINSVTPAIKWEGFRNVLIPSIIGSIIASVLYFIGMLFENQMVGIVGVIMSLVLTLSWIVAGITFNSRLSSIKSVKFIGLVLSILAAIFILLYTSNKLDTVISYGGFFAGLLHSPTVLGVSLILIISVGILFFTNIGVIYINKTEETKLSVNIKEFVFESIKRFWLFLWQPAFVALISIIIIALPFFIIKNAAELSSKYIVDPHLKDKQKEIIKDLNINLTSDEDLYDLNKVTDKQFKIELDSLKTELELSHDVEENTVYMSYIAKVANIKEIPCPLKSSKELEQELKTVKELLDNTKKQLKEVNKNHKNELKYLNAQSSEIQKGIPSYYSQQDLENHKLSIKNVIRVNKRENEKFNLYISDLEEQVSNVEGRPFRYNLAFMFYLISKAIIFSFLVTLIFRLYAYTVQPVYNYYKSNFIVSVVEEERVRNKNQPWLGWFILVLVFIGLTFVSPTVRNLVPNDILKFFMSNKKENTIKTKSTVNELTKQNVNIESQEETPFETEEPIVQEDYYGNGQEGSFNYEDSYEDNSEYISTEDDY